MLGFIQQRIIGVTIAVFRGSLIKIYLLIMIINPVFLYRNTQKEKKITVKYTPRGNWS